MQEIIVSDCQEESTCSIEGGDNRHIKAIDQGSSCSLLPCTLDKDGGDAEIVEEKK